MNSPLETFSDRRAAGRALAEHLPPIPAPLVLAIPRGGMPVAFHLADALGAEVDVLVSRRLHSPHDSKAVVGAVAESGATYFDERAMQHAGVSERELSETIAVEALRAERSARLYREGHARAPVEGRTVLLVDDGVVTGASARAAIIAIRALAPRKLILAVPVAELEIAQALRPHVDALISAKLVPELGALSRWYEDFGAVTDGEVVALLRSARKRAERALDAAVP